MPDPALPGWNTDWEAGGSWPSNYDPAFRAIFDHRVWDMFVAAANERSSSLYAGSGGIAATASTGDLSLNWIALQADVVSLAVQYVQAYDGGGTALAYTTPFGLHDFDIDPDATAARLRRKFPREIADPSDPGTAGQVARLIIPGGGGGDSGALFTHDGTAWAKGSTTHSPDVLTDTGIGQSGDYFGPWILNDLRDVLNDLVVQLVRASAGTSLHAQTEWDGKGENNTNHGTDAADYDGLTHLGNDPSGGPRAVNGVPALGGNQYLRTYSYPRVFNMGLGGTANRKVHLFVYADAPPGDFDDEGDGFSQAMLTLVDTSGSITADNYTGGKVGSLIRPPNPGGYGTGLPDGDPTDSPVAFVRWDVAGGYAFTKFT